MNSFKVFNCSLNLKNNEIRNFKLHTSSSNPLNPVEGQIYFNSQENKIKIFKNNKWALLDESNDITIIQNSTTLNNLHNIILLSNNSPINIYLPSISNVFIGKKYIFKTLNTDISVNNVTIIPAQNETIDNFSELIIRVPISLELLAVSNNLWCIM